MGSGQYKRGLLQICYSLRVYTQVGWCKICNKNTEFKRPKDKYKDGTTGKV